MSNQAKRIIEKFGTPYDLENALHKLPDESSHIKAAGIYKWMWPKERKGRDGFIPPKYIAPIKQAAVNEGILITAEDLYKDV